MAKLNKTGTTILWRMKRDDGPHVNHYALRSDGVLLSKLTVTQPGLRHDYGWKVALRGVRSESSVREGLTSQGYQRCAN